jgi:hypothetical protein
VPDASGVSVKSATISRFGAATTKWRLTLSSARMWLGSAIVVRNFPFHVSPADVPALLALLGYVPPLPPEPEPEPEPEQG